MIEPISFDDAAFKPDAPHEQGRESVGDAPKWSDPAHPRNELFSAVYDDLCAVAQNLFRSQPVGHTLQPTALVHEAYLRLARSGQANVNDRTHALAVGAKMMRQILIDHARRRGADKRGGNVQRVMLDSVTLADKPEGVDFLDLQDALTRLERLSPRQSEVVELRFFGGLTNEEVAQVLGVTSRTVRSDWQFARAWLINELYGREEERR